MGACHPMATLKYTDSVTSFPQIICYIVVLKVLKYEFFTIFENSLVITLIVLKPPQVSDLYQYIKQDLTVVEQLLRGLSLNN